MGAVVVVAYSEARSSHASGSYAYEPPPVLTQLSQTNGVENTVLPTTTAFSNLVLFISVYMSSSFKSKTKATAFVTGPSTLVKHSRSTNTHPCTQPAITRAAVIG